MTKRFSPKAGDYTARLADLQLKKQELRDQLKQLEAEEASLEKYLLPFYDQGKTLVETVNGEELTVSYSTSERQYLDQEKAIALLTRAGKRVPYFKRSFVSFKVKA